MSMLARSAAPLRQVAVRARAAPVRSMHGEYKHIPFNYDKKPVFAAKVAAYLGIGFFIPFIAAFYQLSKST
ncbi:hypothetical protein BN946_scf185043.g131 [Trametes cinnabarina]|uniref:Cytochrome c oxidase subunit 8, mitochondrial n=1 Tax=Pycnoporus cinnabarinus TaxID=5643 RepID=A0A060SIP9_PYCCI|nr:hypothetical protein BN946_scf185043.g131 [Trametes cinnabarina]